MKQVIIDCRAVSGSAQLHDLLARELDFPDWYGHNLDALYDCLTELDCPAAITLTGLDAVGDWIDGFADVFSDAAGENPALTVRLEM